MTKVPYLCSKGKNDSEPNYLTVTTVLIVILGHPAHFSEMDLF